MKNVIVRLRDLEGNPFLIADVTARYTREVTLTDGTIIPAAIKAKPVPSHGGVSFDVYASDDPDVHPDRHGFAVELTASMRTTYGALVTYRRTVTPLDAMADTLTLGDLLEMEQA